MDNKNKRRTVRTQRRRKPFRRGRKSRLRRRRVLCQRLLLGALVCVLLVVLAVVFWHFWGRTKAEAQISEACEAYRSWVREIAAEYDMSEYEDLIMAVMMQESSGRGTDVMQASECQYNTEYPRTPNGITDTEYSIRCGIQELRHALRLAEAKGPKDLKAIGLALQGYNFGSDSYLAYMKQKGETKWSHETAEDFAQMASGGVMREENDRFYEHGGKWQYGDQYYTEHVLRYYRYAR